jgi:hypothetical protein
VLNAGYVSGGSSSSSGTINGNTAQFFEVPDFLYYTGDCSDGDLDVTAIAAIPNTTTSFNYCNLNISNSGTLDLGGPSAYARTFVLLVQDTLRIEGLLTGFNPLTSGGSTSVATNSAGGAGGGGTTTGYGSQFGTANNGQTHSINWGSIGTVGGASIIPPTYATNIQGGTGIPANNCGGNGDDASIDQLREAIKIRSNLEGGKGGGGSVCVGSTSCTGVAKGAGGDGLYIVCDVLDFTGTINLRGFSTGTQGGGGGGGSLVISAREVIQNTGTVLLEGGHGGSTSSTSCGKGGAGAFLIIDR